MPEGVFIIYLNFIKIERNFSFSFNPILFNFFERTNALSSFQKHIKVWRFKSKNEISCSLKIFNKTKYHFLRILLHFLSLKTYN